MFIFIGGLRLFDTWKMHDIIYAHGFSYNDSCDKLTVFFKDKSLEMLTLWDWHCASNVIVMGVS